MKSKLLLSLWLIGGVLYAGSTVFLANTLLGSGNKSDGSEAEAVAAALADKCETENVASAEADPPTTAAVQPKAATNAEALGEERSVDATLEPAEVEAGEGGLEQQPGAHASTSPQEDPASAGEEGTGDLPWGEQGAESQEGEDGATEGVGEGEWAHVVAGTANMRSEPSLASQMVYALPAGWQVKVVSKAPGWVQVQDANSGASGWVEATAIAPLAAQERRAGYGGYPGEEGYPYGEPQRQKPRGGGQFGDFLRRAFGGF